MKKNLAIKGTVELTRQEVVAIVAKDLLATQGLKVEKIVCVDSSDKPVPFENMIAYVHEAKKDLITKKYDDAKTIHAAVGITRPNYGIGKFLKELFADQSKVYTFAEIFQEAKLKFIQIDPKTLKKYLTRPEMTGPIEVTEDGEWFSGKKRT